MKGFVLIFLSLQSLFALAQEPVAILESGQIQAAYVDRPGDLYLLLQNGTLQKFDIDGKLVSEKKFAEIPTLFDPRDGARAFVYYRTTQKCSFYSGEMNQDYKIEDHYAIEPMLVCSSGEHQVWIVDRSDWSLKRVNLQQSKVVAEALIDQKQFTGSPEFTYIRVYQNFLFLVEKTAGILIFNSLGKQVKRIPVSIEYLNFLGEELYYKKGNRLFFYDLFDASAHEISIDPSCRFALLTDARKFMVYDNQVRIFKNN